jgi:hypothetical protein
MGKPEGKRTLGRPTYRREDNINTYLREIECGDLIWIDLVQDRNRWRALVNMVMKVRLP